MKTTKATKNAVKNTAKTVTSAAPSKAAVKVTLPTNLRWLPMIAIISGKGATSRGCAARQVEVAADKKTGKQYIRATYNENGLRLGAVAVACEIVSGVIIGDKAGRIQLGCYANGRNTGATVTLLANDKAFDKLSRPCVVQWQADDNAKIHGRYIGNPALDMCAVRVRYGNGFTYYWQVEQCANANNKHERAKLLPVGNEKLIAC